MAGGQLCEMGAASWKNLVGTSHLTSRFNFSWDALLRSFEGWKAAFARASRHPSDSLALCLASCRISRCESLIGSCKRVPFFFPIEMKLGLCVGTRSFAPHIQAMHVRSYRREALVHKGRYALQRTTCKMKMDIREPHCSDGTEMQPRS